MKKPELFSTTEEEGHIHIVYKDANGEYQMYDTVGHIHFVRRTEALPIEIDEEGNVEREAIESTLVVEPMNSHTHNLLPIISVKKESELTKGELLKEFYFLYMKAHMQYEDFIKRSNIAYSFYIGGPGQWCLDRDAEAELKSKKRAVISTNEIQPIIDAISGQQRQQRTSMKAIPTETGDPVEADIATTILRHVDYCNQFKKKESEIFKSVEIIGRGDIDVSIDVVNTISPKIKLSKGHYKDIFYGPHEEDDLSDCEWLFKRKWTPFSSLIRQFPNKKKELEHAHNYFSKSHDPSTDNRDEEVNNEQYRPSRHVAGEPLFDSQTRKYQVITLERKVYKTVPIAVVEEKELDNLYQSLEGVDQEIVSEIKKASKDKDGDINLINNTSYKIEVMLVAGDVILQQYFRGISDFSSLPCYAKKENGYVYGIVEPVIPHQREINKRHCQSIDAVRFSNAGGWTYDGDTFPNKKEENKFVNRANDPTAVFKLNSTSKPPVKLEAKKNIGEPNIMLELSSSKMKAVSGVNLELLGAESNARSGIAIARRLRQGLVANDFLFDNLSFWKERLGTVILKYVQEYFSTEDIMKILKKENGREKIKLGDNEFSKMTETKVRSIIDNMDFTKYDVVISESASSPTKAMDLLAALNELTNSGQLPQSPMITIDVLKNSGLLDPETATRYMEEIKSQQEAERAIEVGKQTSEKEKVMLANQK